MNLRMTFVPVALSGVFSLHSAVLADSVFMIEDPDLDFEVLDLGPFDGLGDAGPFSTFNTIGLGSIGDDREIAEFDLSGFSIPSGDVINSAVYEVKITSLDVFGLGVPLGDNPDSISAWGYVGNGIADLSDFEAGDCLGKVDTSAPFVGQILTFDVFHMVEQIVENRDQYLGITLRGDEFGLMAIIEGGGFPRLIITTSDSGPCLADLDESGSVGFADLLILLNAWGLCPICNCPADLDGGGDVGFADLLILLSTWGPC